jgi:hypothetical protein
MLVSMLGMFRLATATTIYDVQQSSDPGPADTWPSDMEGETVTITGVVTATGYYTSRFFLQDGPGEWNGILVWDSSIQPQLGDLLEITGTVFEYYGQTEISPVTDYQLLATGQPIPEAALISTGQIGDEAWEEVLVSVENVVVSQPWDSYQQWWVDDGSGSSEVDDAFFNLGDAGVTPFIGQSFARITGIIDYQYSNHALNPRTVADLLEVEVERWLAASETSLRLGESASCWLNVNPLDPEDEVSSYNVSFSLPTELVSLDGLITEGSLSAGLSPILENSGMGEYTISLEATSSLAGDGALVGLQFTGLAPGEGRIELLGGLLGGLPFEQLSGAALQVARAPEAIGDTLTLIMRPLLNIPSIVSQGEVLEVWADAAPDASAWTGALLREGLRHELNLLSADYDPDETWWRLAFSTPTAGWTGLADLELDCSLAECDTSWHAVKLMEALPESYYIAHVTDTHLPTHSYYYEEGALEDSSSMADLRAVFADLAVIQPAFLLLTGDLINEGELEDFLEARYYTRAQRLLAECEVPVYLTAGNHDIGGWNDTPPAQGTSRRDWWRFFGWPRLDNPPAGAPARTQDYFFSHGNLFLVGLEAYDNYDGFRSEIYGNTSYTDAQLVWLDEAFAQAGAGQHRVLFHHYDFANQLDLAANDIELALWGHGHSNQGSLAGPPWSLETDQCTDGACAFRLIRVTPDGLQPLETLYACDGNPLRTIWSVPNDGTATSLEATVDNNYAVDFPEARLVARLQPGLVNVSVSGASLQQVLNTPEATIVEAGFFLPAGGFQAVEFNGQAEPDAPLLQITYAQGWVTLYWSAIEGAASYRVEGRDTASEPWQDISQAGSLNGTAWTARVTQSQAHFRVIATSERETQ